MDEIARRLERANSALLFHSAVSQLFEAAGQHDPDAPQYFSSVAKKVFRIWQRHLEETRPACEWDFPAGMDSVIAARGNPVTHGGETASCYWELVDLLRSRAQRALTEAVEMPHQKGALEALTEADLVEAFSKFQRLATITNLLCPPPFRAALPKVDYAMLRAELRIELARAFHQSPHPAAKTNGENVAADEGEKPSPDFRSVRWGAVLYTFTTNQAACVEKLWAAREAGTPELGGQYVMEAAGVARDRFDLVFRNHPAWGVMIVTGKTRGAFRIAESSNSAPAPARKKVPARAKKRV